jgi:DNA repair protein REV1
MVMHGGRFENYFYRPPVTHVICSNLPDTKLKQMAKERCV